MTKFITLFSLILLTSCGGGKKEPSFYPASESSFQNIVNDKNMEAQPNLTLDKSIVNNDYPIEIAFYKDNKFYYNLPNLGDGSGTWEFKNGLLALKAKRPIFDMYIEVHSVDEAAKNFALEFLDRHGRNVLVVEKQNI